MNKNRDEYGKGVGRWGKNVLAIRYDDRTHFIYELLQNTEDSIARRTEWQGSRSVRFHLTENELRVNHFGHPFNEDDVRGICGIDESTKALTAIGRFGLGFKSVYAFSDRPEIHSGQEDFAIENFVWPIAVASVDRQPDETIIILPLKSDDTGAAVEITHGLQRLGKTALLFLRQIEEIEWCVDGGPSGLYLRSKPDILAEGVRRISVIGQEEGKPEIAETWLVFSRPVTMEQENPVGNVEIAFALSKQSGTSNETVMPIKNSPLVVFFPTVVETHLGFLVQGPYRTTPSRDNVPRNDTWNQHCVNETVTLLLEALRWLCDHKLLNIDILCCLPLDSSKFGEGAIFSPMFSEVKDLLSTEPLLPRFDGAHVTAEKAMLARTQELREIFNQNQLAKLFGSQEELYWLSSDITHERTPELRQYLMRELNIPEVTPESITLKLNKDFLEEQSDLWILKLYEFLNGQPALRRKLYDLPLIRLESREHVVPKVNGQNQAFLPGTITTEFPTVHPLACSTDAAKEFLRSLGLTEPDPVDDVIWHVLPKYHGNEVEVRDLDYESDISRILTAFTTDSKAQREKLVAVLREAPFVKAVDSGDGSKCIAKPGDVYFATERLKELFDGVRHILIIDNIYACLRGEDIRILLESCGATRYLQPIPVATNFSKEHRSQLRREAGLERSTWEKPIFDTTIRGLQELLAFHFNLNIQQQQRLKAGLLWEALADLESRRGSNAFNGEYTWGYFHESKTATFDAAFVRQLNSTPWIPDVNGKLQCPEFVLFESLGWKPNPFLQSKIHFKPPIIETLAKEAGIEPGVLDLLKKLGVTSEAELRSRLGVIAEPGNIDDALEKLLGKTPEPTPPVPDPLGPEPNGAGGANHKVGTSVGGSTGGSSSEEHNGKGKRTPGSKGGRPFISYIGAHPNEEEPDPDGLDQKARMTIEEKAIEFIRKCEPELQPTEPGNPGYDLFKVDENGKTICWIEVKAMTGSLNDRPVGMSHTQFKYAQKHMDNYWLYIVENASDIKNTRLVRIQDPAGKARTYTFDYGWLSVAAVTILNDQDHLQEPKEE